jgi:HSP20 family protein
MMLKIHTVFHSDTGEQRAELSPQGSTNRAGSPRFMRKKTMAEVAVQKTESFWDEIQKMEERVMRRAYDISQGNGSFGRDLDNWLAAERELVRKPAIEVVEKDNRFEIKVAVTGIDPKDLKVDVTEEDLLVKGETRTEKKKEEKGEVYTSEFESGSLFRSIHFPKKVVPNKVKAEIKNGLLTVTAPIAEEARTQKVKVQSA